MMRPKELKIPYVYFDGQWNISEGRLPLPPRRATAVRIEEYQASHRRRIYCPKCGVPCYKSPQGSGYERSGKPAHFAHLPGYQNIPCGLRTEAAGPGSGGGREEERGRVVESDELIIITRWRDVADETELAGVEGAYRGVSGDGSAPAGQGAAGRHVGEDHPLPQRSGSLLNIAARLDEYMTRGIRLPGSRMPETLAEVLTPLHAVDGDAHPPRAKIFWGRITGAFAGNIYLFVNVTNAAGHYVSVQVPLSAANARRMRPDNLANRFIMAHGCLRRDFGREAKLSRRPSGVNCWHVRVEHVGQVALVPAGFEPLLCNGRP